MTSRVWSSPVISRSIHTSTAADTTDRRDDGTMAVVRRRRARPRSDGRSPSRASSSTSSCAAGSGSWPSTAARSSGRPTSSPRPPPTRQAPRCTSSPTRRPTRRTSRRPTCDAGSRRRSHAFLDHVDVVVTVHGYGRDGMFTSLLLGGRNRGLADDAGSRARGGAAGLRDRRPTSRRSHASCAACTRQPGQRASRRRRADRAAAAGAWPRAAVGGLGRATGSCRRPPRSSTCWLGSPARGRRREAGTARVGHARDCLLRCAAARRRHARSRCRSRAARRARAATSDDRLRPPCVDLGVERRPRSTAVGIDEHRARRSATGTAPGSTSASIETRQRAERVHDDRLRPLLVHSIPTRARSTPSAFEEEPVAAWWRTSPFTNVRVLARTFVARPGRRGARARRVRSGAGRAPSRRRPLRPTPTWERRRHRRPRRSRRRPGASPSLTYSSTGHVTRIRFTAGC